MASVVRARWESLVTTGLPRADRRGCEYDAYVPDTVAGREFVIHGDVAADVADAEHALHALDVRAQTLGSTEALGRLLLRAESVASSHIEGLEVGGRRLLRAEAARQLGVAAEDVTAEEVLGNIEATRWAIDELASAEEITTEHLAEVHRRLFEGTRPEAHGGRVRTTQNWIGGSSYNPCSAAFVPPPPDRVRPLLEDLCSFISEDGLPAVIQAALVHAQFETVHPFGDGNGRVGRALIHVVLRRRTVTPHALAPISLVLATWTTYYVNALMGTRYRGGPESNEAVAGLNRWIGLFAAACTRAVHDAIAFEDRIGRIRDGWRTALGRVRQGSAVDLLIGSLPGAPIVTVNSAARLIDRSFERTNAAVSRLVDAKVLRPMRVGRRNRAFEASSVIQAFADLERQLASPAGDTLTSPTTRPVPRRRPRLE